MSCDVSVLLSATTISAKQKEDFLGDFFFFNRQFPFPFYQPFMLGLRGHHLGTTACCNTDFRKVCLK